MIQVKTVGNSKGFFLMLSISNATGYEQVLIRHNIMSTTIEIIIK